MKSENMFLIGTLIIVLVVAGFMVFKAVNVSAKSNNGKGLDYTIEKFYINETIDENTTISIPYYNATYKGLSIITPVSTRCVWKSDSKLRDCTQDFTIINNYGDINLNWNWIKKLVNFQHKTKAKNLYLSYYGNKVSFNNIKSYFNSHNIVLKKGNSYNFSIEFQYHVNAFDEWNLTFTHAVYNKDILIDPTISACSVLDTDYGVYTLTADILDSSASVCMNISANNVVLDCQGHTIDGIDTFLTYGIYIRRSFATTTNITVKNCILTDWYYGIYNYYSDSNTFTNITANSNGYGIYNRHSDSNTFTNITANSNDYNYGIYNRHSDSNTFTNITANSNNYGIYNYYSDSNTFTNITANSNSRGIYNYYSDSNTFTNITAKLNGYHDVWYDTSLAEFDCNSKFENVIGTDDKPIVFYNTTVNIKNWNNNVSEIILCGADNSTISNLIMDRISTTENNALLIVASQNVSVSDSRFIDLEDGIYISYSDSNTFTNITANSNNYGIYNYYSDSNTFTNITANSNNYGIYNYYSDSNTFTNITANSNSRGIYNYYSDSNTLRNSKISNSNSYGIYMYSSGSTGENTIYNNIFNNTNNFYFGGTIYANNWSVTKQIGDNIFNSSNPYIGGNYWTNSTGNGFSDTCTDSDSDGFCDDSYTLATDNIDYLPLTNEYLPSPNTAPQYSTNITTPSSPATYLKTDISFQINWTDPDGNFANATFQLGRPDGTLTNYTIATTPAVQNISDTWYINFTQDQFGGAGTYNYTWFGIDLDGVENKTDTINYVVSKNSTPQIYSYSINDTYINMNETVLLMVNASSNAIIKTEIEKPSGVENFTAWYNSSHYILWINKTLLGDTQSNISQYINITNIYIDGGNYTESVNSTSLNFSYGTTKYLDVVDIPDPVTNNTGQIASFYAYYNDTEGNPISTAECNLTFGSYNYLMSYSNGRYSVGVSTSIYNAGSYNYNITCIDNSYQTQENSTEWIKIEYGKYSGGGGGSTPVGEAYDIVPADLTYLNIKPTSFTIFARNNVEAACYEKPGDCYFIIYNPNEFGIHARVFVNSTDDSREWITLGNTSVSNIYVNIPPLSKSSPTKWQDGYYKVDFKVVPRIALSGQYRSSIVIEYYNKTAVLPITIFVSDGESRIYEAYYKVMTALDNIGIELPENKLNIHRVTALNIAQLLAILLVVGASYKSILWLFSRRK